MKCKMLFRGIKIVYQLVPIGYVCVDSHLEV